MSETGAAVTDDRLTAKCTDCRRRPLTAPSLLADSDEIVLSATAAPALSADMDIADEEDLTALGRFRTQFYDQDLLTCGVCRRVFALSDILKFIRHKVKTCSAKKPGCSDRRNDGDEDEEEEVLDEDSSTPSPSPGSGDDPQSPAVKSQTPGIINSSQRHKFKLIPPKQQQQSFPHHRSFIGKQSPFNHQTSRKSPQSPRSHQQHHQNRSDKKTLAKDVRNNSPNSGQSVSSLSHSFNHCYYAFN